MYSTLYLRLLCEVDHSSLVFFILRVDCHGLVTNHAALGFGTKPKTKKKGDLNQLAHQRGVWGTVRTPEM